MELENPWTRQVGPIHHLSSAYLKAFLFPYDRYFYCFILIILHMLQLLQAVPNDEIARQTVWCYSMDLQGQIMSGPPLSMGIFPVRF